MFDQNDIAQPRHSGLYAAPRLSVYGTVVELTTGGSNNPSPEGTNQGQCKQPENVADKTRNRC